MPRSSTRSEAHLRAPRCMPQRERHVLLSGSGPIPRYCHHCSTRVLEIPRAIFLRLEDFTGHETEDVLDLLPGMHFGAPAWCQERDQTHIVFSTEAKQVVTVGGWSPMARGLPVRHGAHRPSHGNGESNHPLGFQ